LLAESADVGAIGQHAEAWTEFWRDQNDISGCCAGAPEVQRPIHDHWNRQARDLPAGSRVLDLCCGSGAAALALVEANPHVRVTGVDFAAVPANADPRIELLASMRIESLPFADSSFDGAISQFGFEYSAVELASRELARVLRPGARISFLVHHSEARIATDSRTHRRAIEAICGRELESAFLSGNAAALNRQLSLFRRQYPYERIVEDAGQGLRRHIGLSAAHRSQIWQAVKAALAPELVMLADLDDAAVSPEQMRSWFWPLAKSFDLRPPSMLAMAGGQPLCWKIEGVRLAALH
jgi:SAM-dependent methyltransferase